MKLRFKRDTVYQGESYGPGYPQDVTDVVAPHIAIFIASSRAEPITDEELAARPKARRGLPGATTREAPASPPVQCKGTTKKGGQCKAKALAGSGYCRVHTGPGG